MADNKSKKTRVIDVDDTPFRGIGDDADAMADLQRDMAEQAGTAAREATHRLAQAIGAATVAGGLRLAYPLKELLAEVGESVAETLESVRIIREHMEDDNDNG